MDTQIWYLGSFHNNGDTDGLILRMALIAFHHLTNSHDEESLADIVLQLLDRAGITGNVQ